MSKKWSKKVMETSNAMDIKPGLFKGSSREVARDLKSAATSSPRTKGTKFSSAMSMLNFAINRAGSNLSAERRETLERAKDDLRKEFKKK
jgi:hypothetical protein